MTGQHLDPGFGADTGTGVSRLVHWTQVCIQFIHVKDTGQNIHQAFSTLV